MSPVLSQARVRTVQHTTIFATIAVSGVVMILSATRWGAGLSPDSVAYITAARSLKDGRGLTMLGDNGQLVPMTHFPPLLSALLAGVGMLGVDPVTGVRWVNAFLFGINLFTFGMVLRARTGKIGAACLVSLLVFFSRDILAIHGSALSEPLFIWFALLSLLSLETYIRIYRYRWLLMGGATAGLAVLARYAGAAVVGAGVVGLLIFLPKTRRRRICADMTFLCVSSSFLILWFLRNHVMGYSATNRELAFHPPTGDHVRSLVWTVGSWVLPGRTPSGLMYGVGGVILFGGVILCARHLRQFQTKQSMARSGGSFRSPMMAAGALSYIAFLVASISFVDAYTPLDFRILAPWYVVVGFVAALSMQGRMKAATRGQHGLRSLWALILIMLAGLLVFVLIRARKWVMQHYRDGQGYASVAWRTSATIATIGSLDESQIVYTNGPDAVYILTGRLSRRLPKKYNPTTGRMNPNYGDEVLVMLNEMRENDGVLVYLRELKWRAYHAMEDELRENLPLVSVEEHKDGAVYKAAP